VVIKLDSESEGTMMDKKENGTKEYKPPYIPTNIWTEFFRKMQTVNKPSRLSADELKEYGIAKKQEAALISGLKFLGLLDSRGNTTDAFKSIQVSGERFKENLGHLLKAAYTDLLNKHPLEHATYEGIKNYFSEKHSIASASKMAKSFGTLCQQAGWDSPAFSKMRALPKKESKGNNVRTSPTEENRSHEEKIKAHPRSKSIKGQTESDELLKDFIKTNPLPTTGQWNSETLKTYFEQYRETIKMLREKEQKKE
jgi:hypothetical protein